MSRTWLNGISDGAVICCVEPYSRTLLLWLNESNMVERHF
jgi:hypothetical protein